MNKNEVLSSFLYQSRGDALCVNKTGQVKFLLPTCRIGPIENERYNVRADLSHYTFRQVRQVRESILTVVIASASSGERVEGRVRQIQAHVGSYG